MRTPPAGISEADWLLTPSAVRAFILAQQQEIEQHRAQLTALATELAQLRERTTFLTVGGSGASLALSSQTV